MKTAKMTPAQAAYARLQQAIRSSISDIHHTIFDIDRGATQSETKARLALFVEQNNDRLTAASSQIWLALVEIQNNLEATE